MLSLSHAVPRRAGGTSAEARTRATLAALSSLTRCCSRLQVKPVRGRGREGGRAGRRFWAPVKLSMLRALLACLRPPTVQPSMRAASACTRLGVCTCVWHLSALRSWSSGGAARRPHCCPPRAAEDRGGEAGAGGRGEPPVNSLHYPNAALGRQRSRPWGQSEVDSLQIAIDAFKVGGAPPSTVHFLVQCISSLAAAAAACVRALQAAATAP